MDTHQFLDQLPTVPHPLLSQPPLSPPRHLSIPRPCPIQSQRLSPRAVVLRLLHLEAVLVVLVVRVACLRPRPPAQVRYRYLQRLTLHLLGVLRSMVNVVELGGPARLLARAGSRALMSMMCVLSFSEPEIVIDVHPFTVLLPVLVSFGF
jgi:hypothetical protein